MSKIEPNAFRSRLEHRQAELETGNRNREALAIETSPDELDRIQHAGERDWAMSNLQRNSDQLREVQDALRRIDAGTFGICQGCEEDLNPKRLAAVPWAASCINCQEAAEREQRTPRGGIDAGLGMAA
jgi:DnaK suppressor protein